MNDQTINRPDDHIRMKFNDLPCNLCGSRDYKVRLFIRMNDEEPSRIVQCNCCSLRYLNPMPSIDSLEKLYEVEREGKKRLANLDREILSDRELEEFNEKNIRYLNKRFDDVLSVLRRKDMNFGRILDLGADTGEFLAMARERGWEVYGIEISKQSVAEAKRKYGLDISISSDLERLPFQDNFFNVVSISAVIEHLVNPKQVLKEINRVLRVGGKVVIFTDNDNSVFQVLGRMFNRLKWIYEKIFKTKFILNRGNRAADQVIKRTFKGRVEVDEPANISPQGKNEFLIWMFHHLHYFTFKTLKRILRETGFNVVAYPPGAVASPKSLKQRIIYNDLFNGLFKIINRQMNLFVIAEKK